MKQAVLSAGGFAIRINFKNVQHTSYARDKLYTEITEGWKSFIIDTFHKVDFTIDIVEKNDIALYTDKQRKTTYIASYYEQKGNKIVTFYTISIFVFQYILKRTLEKLLAGKGFILHSSASLKDNAYLFLGQSGAGKSTLVALVNPTFPVLADDSVIIKYEDRKFWVYQTPFWEKNNWYQKNSKRYLLQACCFIVKDKPARLIKLDNKNKVLELLMKQTYFSDKTNARKSFKILMRLVNKYDAFYNLYFPNNRTSIVNLIHQI